jgi:hypothetical protein
MEVPDCVDPPRRRDWRGETNRRTERRNPVVIRPD